MRLRDVSMGRVAAVALAVAVGVAGVLHVSVAQAAVGTVRIARDSGRAYGSIGLALADARDGDTLVLSAGTFREPVTISGKRVRIEGAGAGATVLHATTTPLKVMNDGQAEVVGLTIRALGDRPFPLVTVQGDGFLLEDCVVEGARGYGVEIRGAGRDIALYGNTIRGNRGGVRFVDAVGGLRFDLIVDNAGPGVLVEGQPPRGGVVVVEHATVVRNLIDGVAVAAAVPGALDAPLPAALRGRLAVTWSVLSGRIPETLLTEQSAAALQTRNMLLWPKQVEKVFEDVEEGNYRPEDAIPTDEDGVELGARLSTAGVGRLPEAVERALEAGHLAAALRVARRAGAGERARLQGQIRKALYGRYVAHVEAGQFGLAMRELFSVLPHAPAAWNLAERFRQAAVRGRQGQAIRVDWRGFFSESPAYAAAVEREARGGEDTPARPMVEGAESVWTVSATVEKALLVDREPRPFSQTLELPNPEFGRIEETVQILKSRRASADRDRRKTAEKLEAAEARGSGARVRSLQRKLERLSQRIVDLDAELRRLEGRFGQTQADYRFPIEGVMENVTARAEVSLELTSPVGKVIADRITLDRKEQFVSVEPVPLIGFAGVARRAVQEDAEVRRYVSELVREARVRAVGHIEARDAERMRLLGAAARAGGVTDADVDELFALVDLYAVRLAAALAAEEPSRQLKAARDAHPALSEPEFALVYDKDGRRQLPVRLEMKTGAPRVRAEQLARLSDLRWERYWKALEELRPAFTGLTGRSLESFVRATAALHAK